MNASDRGGLTEATTQLQATIVEYEDAPNECTIFPRNTSRMDRMTTWISAKQGSYVDLESVI